MDLRFYGPTFLNGDCAITTKEDVLYLEIDIEKRFDQQILWIVGTSIDWQVW